MTSAYTGRRKHRRNENVFYIRVSMHRKSIIYNKPTRCNSGGIVFIKNYKYALHVSDALCVHLQEHYKLYDTVTFWPWNSTVLTDLDI